MTENLSKIKPQTNRGLLLTILIIVFIVFSILLYYTVGLQTIFLIILSGVAILFLLTGFTISASGKLPKNDIPKQLYDVQDELRKNQTLQLTDQITLLKQKKGQYEDIFAYEREIIIDQQRVMEDILNKTEEAGLNIQDIKLKMQHDFSTLEKDSQQRRREFRLECESKVKKLEEGLKKEEERRKMLEQRRMLENARINLEEQLQVQNYENNIENIIQNHRLILEILLKWQKTSKEQNIQSTIDSAISNIKSSIENLESQKSNIGNRIAILETLKFTNDQIIRLKDTLSYQRAAPVFSVISFKETKLFSIVNHVHYLCECCYKPLPSIQVKKIRKWVRWGLLGMRVFIKLPFIDSYLELLSKELKSLVPERIPQIGKDIIDKSIDKGIEIVMDEVDDKLKDIIKECSESLNSLSETFIGNAQMIEFPESDNVTRAITDIREKKKETQISMGERLIASIKYYQKIIKPGNYEEINNYLEKIEKIIWNNFSHDEQEEIRKRLKETGNSHVFTNDLILKNGLYLCNRCVEWIEKIETETL